MNVLSSSAVVGLLALAALVSGCGDKSEVDLLKAARSSVAKNDSQAAMVDLKAALQQNPSSAEARFLLGSVLLDLGDGTAALVELNKAQELGFNDDQLVPRLARGLLAVAKPKDLLDRFGGMTLGTPQANADLKASVAVALARLDRIAEADAAAEAALKLNPKHVGALLVKARLAANKGDFDTALAQIDKATTGEGPRGEAFLLRGAVLRHARNDVPGSIAAMREALKDPQSALPAHLALIGAFLTLNRAAEAKAQLAELKKAYPKHLHTLIVDAQVAYMADRDLPRAMEILQRILQVVPNDPKLLVLAGGIELQRGALLAAEAHLGKAVQLSESAPVARKLLAEAYLRMGQAEKAINMLRPLLGGAADGEAMSLAGHAYLQAGDLQQAESMFNAAVKARPKDVGIRTALALTDLVKGNADSAFEALQTISASDPGEMADLALISAHIRRAEYSAALTAIDALQRKQPKKTNVAHLRGVALRAKGDAQAARVAFETALAAEPSNFASIANLVAMDIAEGKPDEARKRLKAALTADPRNGPARLALIDLEVRQGAKSELITEMLNEAIKSNPGDPAPRVAKVERLAAAGDVSGALAEAQAALAALPGSPEVLDAAGQAQAAAGDLQQAMNSFNKFAAVRPRMALPHLRLADLHARRKDTAAQLGSLKRAYEASPDSAEVHRRLLTLAAATKDFKPVLEMAQDLKKRFPKSAAGSMLEGDAEYLRKNWTAALAAYRAALGKADAAGRAQIKVYVTHLESGRKAEAEQFAASWLKDHPDDVVFLSWLGDQAIRSKDFAAAERRFRRVVELDPRHASAHNNLAWVLTERNSKEAVAVAQKAVALAPSNAAILDTLARAQDADGQVEGAIASQLKALSLAPNQRDYRVNLVKLYVKAGDKSKAAAELDKLEAAGKPPSPQAQAQVDELRRAVGK